MIYFISGPVNSGKSTRLRKIFTEITNRDSSIKADGFYNIRRFYKNQCIGQDLIRLSPREIIPFSRTPGFIPNQWKENCHYDVYSFSEDSIYIARDIILSSIKNNKTVFLDEIGPLELSGSGLYMCLNSVKDYKQDVYAVCRNSCLKNAIDRLKPEQFCVMF